MKKEELKELYLKWINAEKKSEELRKALNNLEKIAKKFILYGKILIYGV